MEFSAKNFNVDPAICGWEPTHYALHSINITDPLIYYGHYFPLLTILFLSGYVFWKNPKGLPNRILLSLGIIFTIWILSGLAVWASGNATEIMFLWSILIHFDLLLYVVTFYFAYAFFKNQMPSWKVDLSFALLFVPLILFGHTSLNLAGFDFTNCWREALEGPLWQYYVYPVEIGITLYLLIFGLRHIKAQPKEVRMQDLIALLALICFLMSFSMGNIVGTIGGNWEIGQYGLLGMSVFVSIIAYLILKYRSFNVASLLAEIIAIWIIVLIGSLLFVEDITIIKSIAAGALFLALLLRLVITKNVRRDLKQHHEIEELAKNLQAANNRLKVLDKMKSEFISIASHQLRGPIASIRGYASMLTEGSYGQFPKQAGEILERISQSSKYMALMVDDYLNVSRIEAGSMGYNLTDCDLYLVTKSVVDETLPIALQKGLLLVFKPENTKECLVSADVAKVRQTLRNVIENAIDFTPSGSIVVSLGIDARKKKVRIQVTDTGIGMNKDTINSLFDKFARARNANKTNVMGTGLGLYISRKIVVGMKGKIWAESEGEGKGSTFIIEFPLLSGKAVK